MLKLEKNSPAQGVLGGVCFCIISLLNVRRFGTFELDRFVWVGFFFFPSSFFSSSQDPSLKRFLHLKFHVFIVSRSAAWLGWRNPNAESAAICATPRRDALTSDRFPCCGFCDEEYDLGVESTSMACELPGDFSHASQCDWIPQHCTMLLKPLGCIAHPTKKRSNENPGLPVSRPSVCIAFPSHDSRCDGGEESIRGHLIRLRGKILEMQRIFFYFMKLDSNVCRELLQFLIQDRKQACRACLNHNT